MGCLARISGGIGVIAALVIVLGPTIGGSAQGVPRAEALGPGGTVSFFGRVAEGESFVWCLDTSGTMAFEDGLATLIPEVTASLASLDPSQQFSLVSYDSNVTVYSPTLLPATATNVSDAIQWVSGLGASGDSCVESGLLTSLGLLAGAPSPTVFIVSDGFPECGGVNVTIEALAAVAAANTGDIPIHAGGVGIFDGPTGFLGSLAYQNGGTVANTLPAFVRGDANGDGAVDLSDAVRILETQFAGSTAPICEVAADANDDGALQGIPDAIALLSHLFVPGAPAPPHPFPECGLDVTIDPLPCTLLNHDCP